MRTRYINHLHTILDDIGIGEKVYVYLNFLTHGVVCVW
jgi:hypothetical protein